LIFRPHGGEGGDVMHSNSSSDHPSVAKSLETAAGKELDGRRGPSPGIRERKSHIFPRKPNDHYAEPRWVAQRLFRNEEFRGLVCDPACGRGHIIDAAREDGLERRFRREPRHLPSLTVITNGKLEITAAYDTVQRRSVEPRGSGWEYCDKIPGSSLWRRKAVRP
jgi:hypothetical protein